MSTTESAFGRGRRRGQEIKQRRKAEIAAWPRSRRWRRRGWVIFGYAALSGFGVGFIGGPAALFGIPLFFGLPLATPFWIAGRIALAAERRQEAKQTELLALSKRCMAPDCMASAGYRSPDGPWQWCREHAGLSDMPLTQAGR